MYFKKSALIILLVLIISGCANAADEEKFTFKNESENWSASISGTYSRGASEIFEETTATLIYKGKEEINSIYVTTSIEGSSFELGKDLDELPTNQIIETSIDNFGFWEAHEEGKDIILYFEWREGESNTKFEEKLILEEQ